MKIMNENRTIWGIHGGKTGDANSLFLRKNHIGLGWEAMPDLSKLEPTRDAFKTKVAEVFPDKKPGAIPNNAGQLFRFVHEVKIGDLVAYPSKEDRQIHIGEIVGNYGYAGSVDIAYNHQREVKWIKSVPRTRFSQGALYEIGSAMSFFQIKNYADEYRATLHGQAIVKPVDEDESVNIVAEEIEETTQDYVLKALAQELKGHPFEDFVAHLLQKMGYNTRGVPPGPDGGVDIIASKDELGFEPPIIKVQVKSKESSIGNPEVSALYGNVDGSEFGLFVTLGSFTNQARNFARNKSNLRLIDGSALVDLVLSHYEDFDVRYKGLIPLKRVYVPEVLSE